MTRMLDEVIDLTHHCDEPTLTTRGTYLAALLAEGHSEFAATSFARNAKPSTGIAQYGVDAVRRFLKLGPRGLYC